MVPLHMCACHNLSLPQQLPALASACHVQVLMRVQADHMPPQAVGRKRRMDLVV